MLRKLRLRKRNSFLIKKHVAFLRTPCFHRSLMGYFANSLKTMVFKTEYLRVLTLSNKFPIIFGYFRLVVKEVKKSGLPVVEGMAIGITSLYCLTMLWEKP